MLRATLPALFLTLLPPLVHLPVLLGWVHVAAWTGGGGPLHGLLARLVLMVVTGLSGFALLRRLGVGDGAALLAACLFELNGTFAWFSQGPALPVAALPLMLLGVEQARARGLAWGLTLGAGLLLLTHRAEAVPPYALLTLIWALCRLGRAPAAWARAGLGAGLGVVICLPAMLHFMPSAGFWPVAPAAPFLPADAALILFPYAYGDPTAPIALTGREAAIWQHGGGYLDLTWATLALSALHRGGPAGRLRLGLGLFLLVSLACAARLAPWLASPRDIMACWSMTAAVLAALALSEWRAGIPPKFRRVLICLAPALPLVVIPAYSNIFLAISERRQGLIFPGVVEGLSISIMVQLLLVMSLSSLLRQLASRVRVFCVSALLLANALGLFLGPVFDAAA